VDLIDEDGFSRSRLAKRKRCDDKADCRASRWAAFPRVRDKSTARRSLFASVSEASSILTPALKDLGRPSGVAIRRLVPKPATTFRGAHTLSIDNNRQSLYSSRRRPLSARSGHRMMLLAEPRSAIGLNDLPGKGFFALKGRPRSSPNEKRFAGSNREARRKSRTYPSEPLFIEHLRTGLDARSVAGWFDRGKWRLYDDELHLRGWDVKPRLPQN
jgi:hypothetical protein